jgi:hypothetical protein
MGAADTSTSPPDDRDAARRSGLSLHPAASTAAFGAVVGALAGIAMGAVAGPGGLVVGGLLGALGGAGVADVLSKIQEHHSAHEQRIDEDIGVIGGDLGGAPPDQPPAFIGAYSVEASGGTSGSMGATPDEGPFPKAD